MTYLRYSQRRPSDDAALRSTGTAEASVARLRKVAAAAASGATIVIVRVREERGVAGRLTLLPALSPPFDLCRPDASSLGLAKQAGMHGRRSTSPAALADRARSSLASGRHVRPRLAAPAGRRDARESTRTGGPGRPEHQQRTTCKPPRH